MCLMNAEVYAQKFGYQRALDYTGVTDEQKALNGFEPTVYTPTNWHTNAWETFKGKFPAFIRYGGGLSTVPPEYFQRNYLGIYPIKQQPLVSEPDQWTRGRYS